MLLVLDAQPLLIYFYRQSGWQVVESILEDAIENNTFHLLSSINLGEIYYSLLREHGVPKADAIIASISR